LFSATLCVFLLRSWFFRTEGEVRWGLWLRFSVVLLAVSVVSLVEGVLLSPYGLVGFLSRWQLRFTS